MFMKELAHALPLASVFLRDSHVDTLPWSINVSCYGSRWGQFVLFARGWDGCCAKGSWGHKSGPTELASFWKMLYCAWSMCCVVCMMRAKKGSVGKSAWCALVLLKVWSALAYVCRSVHTHMHTCVVGLSSGSARSK